MDNDEIYTKLVHDGVCIVDNIFSSEVLDKLQQMFVETEKSLNIILESKNIKYYNYEYVSHFDKEYITYKKYFDTELVNIIELEKGKYDVSSNQTNFKINKKLENIINKFMKKYKQTFGFLTSNLKSDKGIWHRDTINLDGDADSEGNYDDSNMVHNMNPFYFTILMPLVPLTKDNGATEFILGSHKLTYQESINKERVQFETKLGDAIIFDGRIFHRSRENNSDHNRPVLYIVVHRDWYTEPENIIISND